MLSFSTSLMLWTLLTQSCHAPAILLSVVLDLQSDTRKSAMQTPTAGAPPGLCGLARQQHTRRHSGAGLHAA